MAFEWFSNSVSFLVGTAIGAAGMYFADKFTDQRRNQDARKQAVKWFKSVKESMPKLIAQMKDDLSKEEYIFVREFFITSKRGAMNLYTEDKSFIYYYEDHGECIRGENKSDEKLFAQSN